jgi:hypothetical protein
MRPRPFRTSITTALSRPAWRITSKLGRSTSQTATSMGGGAALGAGGARQPAAAMAAVALLDLPPLAGVEDPGGGETGRDRDDFGHTRLPASFFVYYLPSAGGAFPPANSAYASATFASSAVPGWRSTR